MCLLSVTTQIPMDFFANKKNIPQLHILLSIKKYTNSKFITQMLSIRELLQQSESLVQCAKMFADIITHVWLQNIGYMFKNHNTIYSIHQQSGSMY